MGIPPSTTRRPVIPKRSPRTGPSVSSMRSLPRRRTAVTFRPVRAAKTSSGPRPRFRNQASGADTSAIERPTATSAACR